MSCFDLVDEMSAGTVCVVEVLRQQAAHHVKARSRQGEVGLAHKGRGRHAPVTSISNRVRLENLKNQDDAFIWVIEARSEWLTREVIVMHLSRPPYSMLECFYMGHRGDVGVAHKGRDRHASVMSTSDTVRLETLKNRDQYISQTQGVTVSPGVGIHLAARREAPPTSLRLFLFPIRIDDTPSRHGEYLPVVGASITGIGLLQFRSSGRTVSVEVMLHLTLAVTDASQYYQHSNTTATCFLERSLFRVEVMLHLTLTVIDATQFCQHSNTAATYSLERSLFRVEAMLHLTLAVINATQICQHSNTAATYSLERSLFRVEAMLHLTLTVIDATQFCQHSNTTATCFLERSLFTVEVMLHLTLTVIDATKFCQHSNTTATCFLERSLFRVEVMLHLTLTVTDATQYYQHSNTAATYSLERSLFRVEAMLHLTLTVIDATQFCQHSNTTATYSLERSLFRADGYMVLYVSETSLVRLTHE
ncbi:hypothetical protein J6590_063060 [Homalodisca vitripennis]|nr:hypothetical protein J6590_063060 [Homalodisca vitripennis]